MPDKTGFESDFFGVLADLENYLPELTLVGGWVPYVYANFMWCNPAARPIFTSDVDWGVEPGGAQPDRRTVFEVLSALKYSERHLEIGKMDPVVLYRNNKTRLDFITSLVGPEGACAGVLGREVAVSRPDPDKIAAEIRGYSAEPLYAKAMANLRVYFSGETGRGCAMVAQENGPDHYIDDLIPDIRSRFLKIAEPAP